MNNWRISRKVAAGSVAILLALLVVAGSLIFGMLDLNAQRDQDSTRQANLDEIRRAELEMAGLYAIWADATINHDLNRARLSLDRYQASAEPLLARLDVLAETPAEKDLSATVRATYTRYLESIREGLPLVEGMVAAQGASETPTRIRVKDHDAAVDRWREATTQAVGALAEQHQFDTANGAAAFDGMMNRSIRWAMVHTLIGVGLALLIVVASARSITSPIASVVGVLRRITNGDLSHEIAVGRSDELGDILKASAEMQTALRRSIEAHGLAEQTMREIGERFRVAIDNALDAVVTMNFAGEITVWNKQAVTIFGWTHEEALGRKLDELILPDRCQGANELGMAGLSSEGRRALVGRRIEIQAVRRNGEEFPVELAITEAPEGQGVQFTAFLRDITERKEAEGRLHLAASVFTHAREGITITDPEGTILDVNDTFTAITGYKREEVVGRNPRVLKSNRQGQAFYRGMWDDLVRLGCWHGEVWNRRKDGEVYAEMLTISAVRDAQGRTQAYVGLFSDITALKEQGQRLEYLAHYDPLTTLPNRGLLADRLRQGIAQARRRGQPVAVAYLDLDGFKAVNDAYGHEVGDRLLVALATRMKHALRDGDTLARIGGDEFVAIFLDLPDTQSSLPMIERLLAAASQEVNLGALTLRVSASLGVTFFPQMEDVDADQLLRQADQAMYQAKIGGKGRYHIFDAQQDRTVRGHHEGLDRIRQALRAGEFELHYQPKVNMRTGQVMGAEALIRWRHPEKGVLAPAEFLPTIENHPLSIELGEWVMDHALAQMEAWQASGLHVAVSVNVGAQQLEQRDFVDRLRGILAAHPGASPSDLQIEVLETSALEDLVLVSKVIGTCRELGVTFALDDFGAGYSSLTYLKRLPVKMLKIDQSFVRGMLDDPEDLAILQGVVSLAAAFGREVIAEGVETVEHGEMLLQLGCERAQGFGIARPMSAAELKMWVTSWRPDVAWPGITPVNRRDLPVLFAAAEHRAWIREIERHLDGELAAGPPSSHHQCRFGVWLDALDDARRDQWRAIDDIDPVHRRVHILGRTLWDASIASGSGRTEATHELYRARDEMLEQLTRLQREMRRGSHPTVPVPAARYREYNRVSDPPGYESVD